MTHLGLKSENKCEAATKADPANNTGGLESLRPLRGTVL